jgi:multisubunit Na+/H+ antiporter MnhB subunit
MYCTQARCKEMTMRTTGLGFSAVLVVAGAILAWAVTVEVEGVDVNQVGIIMFVVGLVLAAVTIAMSAVGRRTVVQTERESLVGGRPVVERQRDVISDHETI